MEGIVVGARTVTPAVFAGGQYGVSYNAAPYGSAFSQAAWGRGPPAEPGEPQQPGPGQHRRSRRQPECLQPLTSTTGIRACWSGRLPASPSRPGDGARSTAFCATMRRKPPRAMSVSARSPATIPSWPTGSSTTAAALGNVAETAPMSRPGSSRTDSHSRGAVFAPTGSTAGSALSPTPPRGGSDTGAPYASLISLPPSRGSRRSRAARRRLMRWGGGRQAAADCRCRVYFPGPFP